MNDQEPSNFRSRSPRSSGRDPVQPWWGRRHNILLALAALIIAVVIWRLASTPRGERDVVTPPVAVVTATVKQGPFTVFQSALGTVKPLHSVTVRSPVSGRLLSVSFSGGQMVKQGALLATVDPQPVATQLALAQGELARSQALHAQAADTLQRYQQLLTEDSMPPQRVADQKALADQQAADLRVAQSRVDDAKLQLANTRIVAPISGMVGLRRVDPGNFIQPSDAEGITTVTELHPIGVEFALPGHVLADLVKRLHAGAETAVVAYASDTDTRLANGKLQATDNQIDPDTGTVRLQAVFPNTDDNLFPNQFVSVKLAVRELDDAVLLPTAAIQHGADGPFVYVVGADQTVSIAQVELGPGDDMTSVVRTGVNVGTVVVVQGSDHLRAGLRVKPIATAHNNDAPPRVSAAGSEHDKRDSVRPLSGESAHRQHTDDPDVTPGAS